MFLLALAENSIQLVPDGTLLLHLLMIALMVGILNLTLFKPINQILEKRELETRGRLSEAQRIMAGVEEKLALYEGSLREARAESYRQLESQRAAALSERDTEVLAVKQAIATDVAKEKESLRRDAEEARIQVKQESRRMGMMISARILQRPLNQSDLDRGPA